MKLVLQIAFGVFFGALASQLTVDSWRAHREEAARDAALKQRAENEERVRALFMQGGRGQMPGSNARPQGFVPEDVEAEISSGRGGQAR